MEDLGWSIILNEIQSLHFFTSMKGMIIFPDIVGKDFSKYISTDIQIYIAETALKLHHSIDQNIHRLVDPTNINGCYKFYDLDE